MERKTKIDEIDLELEAVAAETKTVEAISELVGEDSNEVEKLRAELADAQEKIKDNWDKVLRATADVANIRARAAKDVENAHKYSLERFAKEIINVVDSLERGIDAAANIASGENLQALYDGVDLTYKLLMSSLEKFGIKQVNPIGEKFDPAQHEALSMQETSEYAANHVMFVAQKGFTQHERVLRPARVVVAKATIGSTN